MIRGYLNLCAWNCISGLFGSKVSVLSIFHVCKPISYGGLTDEQDAN